MTHSDALESARRQLLAELNQAVSGLTEEEARARLEAAVGKDNVWNTQELREAFQVEGFLAPFCAVRRKSDGRRGSVQFTHHPRLYFDFKPQDPDGRPAPSGAG